MKVVVTGGAGFIGANLCRHLLAASDVTEVVVLDNLSTGFRSNLDGVDVTFVEGSLTSPRDLDLVVPGASSVVHLGARPSVPRSIEDPEASHEVNATGTLRVLEAMRRHGVGHIVVASSSSVYGANPVLPKQEELTPMPLSPYAVSKLATESYALSHARCYGIRSLAFRFFNVFGPLQAAGHAYAAVIPAFVSAALDGQPVTVHGDGKQTRDFTFVGSVCEVITEAVVRQVHHDRPVNLAFGGRYSLLDVLTILEDLIGEPVKRSHTEPRSGDVRDSQADQTRLRALFPSIRPVSLEDGLRRTIEWFRSGEVMTS